MLIVLFLTRQRWRDERSGRVWVSHEKPCVAAVRGQSHEQCGRVRAIHAQSVRDDEVKRCCRK